MALANSIAELMTLSRRDFLKTTSFVCGAASLPPWICEAVAEHMKSRDRTEWETILRASDCIWAPVASPLEIQSDPQVVANGYLMDYEDGEGNKTKVCSSPVQFDGEAFRVRSRAPEAGEHTEEVLLEAGYGWEDIGRWKESGVIS